MTKQEKETVRKTWAIVDFPEELKNQICAEAKKRGQKVSEYVTSVFIKNKIFSQDKK